MGFCVRIHIAFEAMHRHEQASRLAAEFALTIDEDGHPEAHDFLSATASGRTLNTGRKGSLYTWGYVGNYTRGEEMAETLRPYFDALWETTSVKWTPVHIFEQRESDDTARVYVLRHGQPTKCTELPMVSFGGVEPDP